MTDGVDVGGDVAGRAGAGIEKRERGVIHVFAEGVPGLHVELHRL